MDFSECIFAVDSRDRRVYSLVGARWRTLKGEEVEQLLVSGGFRRRDVVLPPEALVPNFLSLGEVALVPLDQLSKVRSYLEPIFIKPEVLAQKGVMAKRKLQQRQDLPISDSPFAGVAVEDEVDDSEATESTDALSLAAARRMRQVVDEDEYMEEMYGEGSSAHEPTPSQGSGVRIVDRFEDLPPSSDNPVPRRRPGKEVASGVSEEVYQGIVDSWNEKFNHDPCAFRCISVQKDIAREAAREMRNAVVFYLSHFEAGLRLPVDPFMVEVMIATNTVPVDWGLTTVRAMVVFITLCRSLSFEPTLNLFRHYFLLTVSKGRLQGKRANGALQVWEHLPKKNRAPDTYMLVIESIDGWTFPVASREPKGLGSLRVGLNHYELAAKRSIELFLGKRSSVDENGYGTNRVIDYRRLGLDNEALRLSGIWRGEVEDVEPRCHSFEGPDVYYPGWVVHANAEGLACFAEFCVSCAGDWENCTVGRALDEEA